MNRRTEHDELLADVLAEPTNRESDDLALRATLRCARRRRNWRKFGRGAPVLVGLLLAALIYWRSQPSRVEGVVSSHEVQAQPPFEAVSSRPLSPGEIVTTHSTEAGFASLAHIQVTIVETEFGNFRIIGDDELLNLAAPHVAALVRRSPHAAELVFVEPRVADDAGQN